MAETPRLDLPYLAASQAQKEVYHNISLDRLDLLCQCAVLDRNLPTPPASPALGDAYIVAPGATGTWAGHDHHLALWVNSQWQLIAPRGGFLCWILDEGMLVHWDGTVWASVTSSGGGAISGHWRWTTATSGAPSSGQLGVNHATYASATQIRLAYTNDDGVDFQSWIASLQAGDEVLIQQTTDTAVQARYLLTSSPSDAGTYATLAVSWELGAGSFLHNTSLLVYFHRSTLQGTFLGLTDTPDTYSGQAGKVVQVNAGATALEFGTAGGGGGAPLDATYLVSTAHGALSAERVITDSPDLTWDLATAGQVRGLIPAHALEFAQMQQVLSGTLVGRSSAALGDLESIAVGPGLDLSGGTLSATGGAGGSSDFLGLSDTPDSYSGQAGQGVVVNAGATGLEFTTAATGSYDLGLTWSGPLPASQVLVRYPFPRGVQFPAHLVGSQGVAAVAATGATTLALQKNGTSIGSMQFAASATTATFTLAGGVSFAAGDVLTLHAPATPDATLADLGLSLAGTRSVVPGEMGATSFLGLTDSPDSYAGQAGKVVQVNPGATALEFATQDATLTALAGVTTAANTMPYFTGVDTASTTPLTAFARSLLDDADATAGRATLLLGALAVLSSIGTAQLDNEAVTYAKLQNVSAAPRLLGRHSAGAGDVEEVTIGAGLSLTAGALTATATTPPNASETVRGLVELASNAEAVAGVEPLLAVTPTGLQAKITATAPPNASETVRGLVELATSAEALAGVEPLLAVTPTGLQAKIAALPPVPAATETVAGIQEVATTAETTTGTDDARAVTPLKLQQKLTAAHTGTPLSVVRYAASGQALEASPLSVDAASNLRLGSVTPGTSAQRVLVVASGTAPTAAHPADAVQVWVEDVEGVAGTASLVVRAENGILTRLGSVLMGRWSVKTISANPVGTPYALTTDESSRMFFVNGTEMQYFTLPTSSPGIWYSFTSYLATGVEIRVGGGGFIRLGSTNGAANGALRTTTVGDYLTLVKISGAVWQAQSPVQGWTLVA